MKKWAVAAVAACLPILLLSVPPGRSDEAASQAGGVNQAEPAAPARGRPTVRSRTREAEAEPRRRPRRLPAQFGRLDLSERQRENIYSIQGKYAEQIEELEKQLAAARERRDREIEAVLTDEQKEELSRLRREAAEARRARAAARAATRNQTGEEE